MSQSLSLPTCPVVWERCWRLIPSRYPPISVFERVASPQDFDALYALESLTNDRLRQEVGALHLVPQEDRVYGPGSSYIMSAFTHLNPQGSRFSDGTWGVYYAAHNLETAIEETKYHREQFLGATNLPPLHLDMRVLVCRLEGALHDVRGDGFKGSTLYDRTSYEASQAAALALKKANSNGLIYWSVRAPDGQNVAVFRPKLLSKCRQERHLEYVWDGKRIAHIFEKKLL